MGLLQQSKDIENSKHCSSGYWETIDKITSFGLSNTNPNYRLSKKLYYIRKKTASITGLHGIISGKQVLEENKKNNDEKLGIIKRKLLVIERAKERITRNENTKNDEKQQERRLLRRNRWRRLLSQSVQSVTNLRKELLLDTTTNNQT